MNIELRTFAQHYNFWWHTEILSGSGEQLGMVIVALYNSSKDWIFTIGDAGVYISLGNELQYLNPKEHIYTLLN